MADTEGWRILGRHPAEDVLMAQSPAGQPVRLARWGTDRNPRRWVGPLPLGDGHWAATAEDGSVVLALLVDEEVPEPVAAWIRAQAVVVGCLDAEGLLFTSDGRIVRGDGPDDSGGALILGEIVAGEEHPAAWLADRAAAVLAQPPSPTSIQRLDPRPAPGGAGGVAPDKAAIARVTALVLLLGLGAGWWLAPRASWVTVRLPEGMSGEIRCEDAIFEVEGGSRTVPAGLGRCKVRVHDGPLVREAVVDTHRGGQYRCRVKEQGLRCETG